MGAHATHSGQSDPQRNKETKKPRSVRARAFGRAVLTALLLRPAESWEGWSGSGRRIPGGLSNGLEEGQVVHRGHDRDLAHAARGTGGLAWTSTPARGQRKSRWTA